MMRARTIAVTALSVATILAPDAVGQRLAPNGVGIELDASTPDSQDLVDKLPALTENEQLIARIRYPYEKEPPDLGSLLGPLTAKGYRIVLALGGEEPFPLDASLDPWLDYCQQVARSADGVAFFELPFPWMADLPAEKTAFVLKKTSILLTGIQANAKLIMGGIRPGDEPALRRLLAQETVAYIDLYSADGSVGETGETAKMLSSLTEEVDPGSEVWVANLPSGGKHVGSLMRPCLLALGQGFFAATASGLEAREVARLAKLSEQLGPKLAAVPGAKVDLLDTRKVPLENGEAVTFFNSKTLSTTVAWWGDKLLPAFILGLHTADLGKPELIDPLGKKTPKLLDFGKDNAARRVAIAIPMRPYPLLATFPREVSGDIAFEPVKLAVTGREELPVAEIVARFQRIQAEQNDRLRHFRANERISLHYEVSAGTTIDVISDNIFFHRKGGETEWQETAFYVNGVKWHWGARPKLPLIQPEKVATVPLTVTLGKEYSYELKGKEKVDGHTCYVVAFTPQNTEESRFSGRVWIDSDSFVRRKMWVIQTNLVPPVISNEETDLYRPIETPDGTFWLTHRIEGQQIFSIAGTSTPVQREVEFAGYRVNADDFEQARANAEASTDIMFRETETGYRYLDLVDGQRVVNTKETKSSILGAAGVFFEQNLDYPLPLLGFNYFNYDLFDSGSQFNLFFAGLLASATFNKPDLFKRSQLSADFVGVFVPLTDTVYRGTKAFPGQDVKVLNEFADVRLGIPLGSFFRLNASYALHYRRFSEADDTKDSFVLPSNHLEHDLSLGAEWKRSGYRISLDGTYALRSRWEPWGRPGSDDYDPKHRRFFFASLTAGKDFYLPKFMRLHLDASLQTGSRQDRFSKWSFGFFSNRIRGFAGSGIRYEEGAQIRGYYGFNIGEVIRLDANLDYATIRDRSESSDRLSFSGAGITATLLGPWKTIINIDYGYGLSSDIPGLEHQSEYRLVIMRIFK